MAQLAEQLVNNHALAAATQSKIRNGRRVIRHEPLRQVVSSSDCEPEFVDDAISVISAPAVLPESTISHQAITLSPLDLPAEQFRSGLDRRKQNRQLLMEWVRTALVDGVDFGQVHIAGKDKCEHARVGRVRECSNQWHWSKPSLFKPGAEKITGMLGMTVHYPSLPALEQAVLSGNPISCIMLRCELHDANGRIVAEGVGARNLAQDYGDFNKGLKMAEKSAHIDATLRLAGLSEVFTQDLEDRPVVDDEIISASSATASAAGNRKAKTSTPKPTVNRSQPSTKNPRAPTTPSSDADAVEYVGDEDIAALQERIKLYGFTEKRVLTWLYKTTQGTVKQLKQLSIAQCVSLLKRLDQWAEAEKTINLEDVS